MAMFSTTFICLQVAINGSEDMNTLRTCLRLIQGVVDVRVEPSNSLIIVEFDSNTVGVRGILKNIEVIVICSHDTSFM